jgi:hypothetical protein
VLGKSDLKDVPQMWAMYKEVMGYFANGVSWTPHLSKSEPHTDFYSSRCQMMVGLVSRRSRADV